MAATRTYGSTLQEKPLYQLHEQSIEMEPAGIYLRLRRAEIHVHRHDD